MLGKFHEDRSHAVETEFPPEKSIKSRLLNYWKKITVAFFVEKKVEDLELVL